MLSTEIATTTAGHTNTLLRFRKSVVRNLSDYKKVSKQSIKMIIHRNDTTTLLVRNNQKRQQQVKWLHSSALFTLLAIFSITKLVVCQDFEDLNLNSNKQSPTFNNGQPAHHSFQPFNRLNLAQQQQQQQQSSASSARFTMQRPILSSRFAPSYSPSAGGGQQLAAQASSSSSIFSGPPSSLGASLQQPQQQVSNGGGSGSSNSGASVSNIEQLMKNALARTAQLNSAASAEPRQDTVTPSQPEAPISTPSRSSVLQQQPQQQQQQAPSTREAALSRQQESNKNAEPSAETSPSEIQSANAQLEDPEKSTTTAQATTTNGHETVYSEQRFANLFARRGNNKKSRITPSEQVKAKPTLPSFIKSPPDPKQFNAAQTTNQDNTNTNNNNNNNNRPVASSSSNSFASQRLQAQNQNRLNQINNQQKKPVITSISAATANSKRNNLQNVNKQSSVAASSNSNSRLASNLNKTSTSKPNVPIPSNNNPFNKSQNLSSDPANVIAMARKRLLANNALESAKLKQQQQKQPN